MAGALPVTPAGLGVVDSVTPLLLVSFGVTRNVATLGVLGWRLVNFWMPIPAGAIAYASLKVPRGAGLRAMRQAVPGMMNRAGDTTAGADGATTQADGATTQADGATTQADAATARAGGTTAPAGGVTAQPDATSGTAGSPAKGDSVLGDAP